MVWKWIDEVYKLTRVVSLAIDEPVEAPTSKAKNNKIHDQVKKQQRSCNVPSYCGHFWVASDFLSSQTHRIFLDKVENFLHRFLLHNLSHVVLRCLLRVALWSHINIETLKVLWRHVSISKVMHVCFRVQVVGHLSWFVIMFSTYLFLASASLSFSLFKL